METLKSWLTRYAAALFSGLLLCLSFPNIFHPDFFRPGAFIAWVALVPLFASLENEPPREALKKGYAAGLLFFTLSTAWINNIKPMGPGAFPAWLALSAYLALYPALFSGLLAWGRQKKWRLELLWVPALWTLLEFVREHLFTGFPWLSLGSSQAPDSPWLALASVTGVYGLHFTVVLINLCLWQSFAKRRVAAALSLGLIAALLALRFSLPQPKAGGPELKVAVLQGNIDQDQAWTAAYRAGLMEAYRGLMEEALEAGAEVLIWPESSFPGFFNEMGPEARELVALAKKRKVDLIFGSSLSDKARGGYTNCAVHIDAAGNTGAYCKRHLVPFGEYIPFRASLPFLDRLLTRFGLTDFRPGEAGQKGFSLRGLELSPLVCYESIYGGLLRGGAGRTDLAVVVTLDTWFGNSAAPRVHFVQGLIRAVENGCWTARAAATGISGFASPGGAITALVPLNERGWAMQAVPGGAKPSVYRVWGPWFLWLCAGLLCLCALPSFMLRN